MLTAVPGGSVRADAGGLPGSATTLGSAHQAKSWTVAEATPGSSVGSRWRADTDAATGNRLTCQERGGRR
jgi:hypothetical protein